MYASKRAFALDVALRFLGLPYRWGGNDPLEGFDCSGFVIEVLKSVAILPVSGDWTANGLYDLFAENEVSEPCSGCLVFWRSTRTGRMRHVELVINDQLSIGAASGGSGTNSLADAMRQDAYVKIRPYKARAGDQRYVDPFLRVRDFHLWE